MTSQAFGERLPGFELPALEGGKVGLDGALERRRGAVVIFWSSVCSHCQRYDGYLNDFAARHGDLALVVIACRQDETAADLRRVATSRALKFPLLRDGDRRVSAEWEVQQTPKVFLLDGERRLRYRGAIDNFKLPDDPEHRPYLEEAIADFAAGREIARQETSSFGCPVQSVYYDIPKP